MLGYDMLPAANPSGLGCCCWQCPSSPRVNPFHPIPIMVQKPSSFKCGTFGASSVVERRLATGNFGGQLQIWDLENTAKPVYEVQAHASIVNALDGCGGQVRALPHRWPSGTGKVVSTVASAGSLLKRVWACGSVRGHAMPVMVLAATAWEVPQDRM